MYFFHFYMYTPWKINMEPKVIEVFCSWCSFSKKGWFLGEPAMRKKTSRVLGDWSHPTSWFSKDAWTLDTPEVGKTCLLFLLFFFRLEKNIVQCEDVMFFELIFAMWEGWNCHEEHPGNIYIYICVLSMLVVPVVEDVSPKPPSFECWSCQWRVCWGQIVTILWFDMFQSIYPPRNKHGTWKVRVGRLLSFQEGLFSVAMLVLGRVYPQRHWGLVSVKWCRPLFLSLMCVFSVVFSNMWICIIYAWCL